MVVKVDLPVIQAEVKRFQVLFNIPRAQAEVAVLLGRGFNNPEIAEARCVSVKTVEAQINLIRQTLATALKLGFSPSARQMVYLCHEINMGAVPVFYEPNGNRRELELDKFMSFGLSKTTAEVCWCIAIGMENQAIAELRQVSVKTVEAQRSQAVSFFKGLLRMPVTGRRFLIICSDIRSDRSLTATKDYLSV